LRLLTSTVQGRQDQVPDARTGQRFDGIGADGRDADDDDAGWL
jgi:hypothetical protein